MKRLIAAIGSTFVITLGLLLSAWAGPVKDPCLVSRTFDGIAKHTVIGNISNVEVGYSIDCTREGNTDCVYHMLLTWYRDVNGTWVMEEQQCHNIYVSCDFVAPPGTKLTSNFGMTNAGNYWLEVEMYSGSCNTPGLIVGNEDRYYTW